MPTYSKSTPYQYEEQLPRPVFGIAHGHPYRKKGNNSENDELQENFQRDENKPFDEEPQKDTPAEYPEDEKQSNEDYETKKRKIPPKSQEESESGEDGKVPEEGERSSQEETKDDGGDNEEEPSESEQSDIEPEHVEQGPNSEEESSHGNSEAQRGNSREDYDEEPQEQQHLKHHRPRPPPNYRESKENGNGSDSERTGTTHYADSGERTGEKKYSREQDVGGERRRGRHRGRLNGKLVGVNMGLVAGVYPHESKDHQYEEVETRKPHEGKRKLPKNRKTMYEQREMTTPRPGYSSQRKKNHKLHEQAKWVNVQEQDEALYATPSQPIRYGPFDAYFVLKPEMGRTHQRENSRSQNGIPEHQQKTGKEFFARKKPSMTPASESSDTTPYDGLLSQRNFHERRPLAYDNELERQTVSPIQLFCLNCPPQNIRPLSPTQTLSRSSIPANVEARPLDEMPTPPPLNFRDFRKDEHVDFGVRPQSRIPPTTSIDLSIVPSTAIPWHSSTSSPTLVVTNLAT
ncbi:unnamed protein product [Strongylus vulgaris]|uniref:Uncharacterized protein n=1 Tax=Strongylus vulgaris TaxID=40348 RepID=A0A3P7IVT7_STRVU|nr:unnamed protein product [Strongylus vulgaris]